MMERPVPWWRRALAIALGGIRSGFGFFRRNGKAATGMEVAQQAEAAVDAAKLKETRRKRKMKRVE